MSDIVISKGIRSNLLQLQNTSANVALTQSRLATGKKVNSALDNPSNFFTASSLNSRANDLNSLLDGLQNGIKVLEAADNGLKAITKTVESLQSTVRQARQDKSNKTVSYELDATAIGTATAKNITFSGGSVGDVGVDIQISDAAVTGVQNVIDAANNTYAAPTAAEGPVVLAGTDYAALDVSTATGTARAFTVQGPGDAAAITINLNATTLGEDTSVSQAEAIAEINDQLNTAGSSVQVRANATDANKLEFYDANAANTGAAATITLGGADEDDLGFTNNQADSGAAAVNRVISISDGTKTADITLTAANGATAAAAATTITAALATAGIVGSASATTGGLTLSGATDGSNTLSIGGAGANQVFGSFAQRTVTAAVAADAGGARTVDEIASQINNNVRLKDKVRASNDNGKLRVENISTTALDIKGLSTTAGVTKVSGSTDTTTGAVGANDVRKNLVSQFNNLRNQLDKLADDAGFNGVNLLRGDKLKLNFNETGTSTLTIQSNKNGQESEISNAKLGVTEATDKEFENDTSLDTRLTGLKDALDTIRSQASAFGSNLSIVQNRTDFTKSTVATLRNGADNLVLADANEEAANLLALQTRQQLSSTALSLANQADQGVLRLF